MGFFYDTSKTKLPLRGRKRLPIRGNRGRRLQLLRQFEVGQVYTFPDYYLLELPEDLPKDLLMEDHHEKYRCC